MPVETASQPRAQRQLVAFATEALETLPGGGAPTALGWRRWAGDAQVLELATPDGRRWFAKRLSLPRKWRRETAAYDAWSPHLAPLMPRLVGRCARRRTLLVEWLPGSSPRPRDPASYRPAGALLARLQDLPLPEGWVDGAGRWDRWCLQVRARAEDQLERVRRLGVPVDTGVVRAAVEEMVALPPQPLVPCHGDFLPRNWLVDGPRLAVIDFAEASAQPRGVAFARLHVNTIWDRVHLFERLLVGYGRALDDDEVRLVELHRALNAVYLLRWGAGRGSAASVARGQQVLAAVAADEPLVSRRPWPRRLASTTVRRVVPAR